MLAIWYGYAHPTPQNPAGSPRPPAAWGGGDRTVQGQPDMHELLVLAQPLCQVLLNSLCPYWAASPASFLVISQGCLHESPLAFITLNLSREWADVVVYQRNLPLCASEAIRVLPSQVL